VRLREAAHFFFPKRVENEGRAAAVKVCAEGDFDALR
jgi:hypothetical protein